MQVHNKNSLKLAIVKSSVYQDLWVCEKTKDILKVFKSTMMRTPPIGISEFFDTEFIIVKDVDAYPCNINKCCLSSNHFNESGRFLSNQCTLDPPEIDSQTIIIDFSSKIVKNG